MKSVVWVRPVVFNLLLLLRFREPDGYNSYSVVPNTPWFRRTLEGSFYVRQMK